MPIKYEDAIVTTVVSGNGVLAELCDNEVEFTHFKVDSRIRVQYVGKRYKFTHSLAETPKYIRLIYFHWHNNQPACTLIYRNVGRFTINL